DAHENKAAGDYERNPSANREAPLRDKGREDVADDRGVHAIGDEYEEKEGEKQPVTPVEATGIYGLRKRVSVERFGRHFKPCVKLRSVKKTCRYRSCRIEYTSKGRVVHHIYGGFLWCILQ